MNKFLEKYPKLREPQVGDEVVTNISPKIYSSTINNVGIIRDIQRDSFGKVYAIVYNKIVYYRHIDEFRVVKFTDEK